MPIVLSIRSTLTRVCRGTSTIEVPVVAVGVGIGEPHEDEDPAVRLPTPVDHHFRPLITISSPSTTAVAAMLVASEEATSGSVIVKADSIFPSSSGSTTSRCSAVP